MLKSLHGVYSIVSLNSNLSADMMPCHVMLLHQVINVTDDGAVTLKTLNDPDGWKKPNDGAKVKLALTGRLPDGTVFEERGADSPSEFVMDEEQVGVVW